MKLPLCIYCETVIYENKQRRGEVRVLSHGVYHLQYCFMFCTTSVGWAWITQSV
jgi:hypothetical protein